MTSRKKKKPAAKRRKSAPARRPSASVKKIPKTPISDISPEEAIVGAVFLGKVKAYSPDLGMMSLLLEAPLAAGDGIRIKSKSTDLTQRVERMEIEGGGAQSADAGESVSVEVADKVKEGDAVYKI